MEPINKISICTKTIPTTSQDDWYILVKLTSSMASSKAIDYLEQVSKVLCRCDRAKQGRLPPILPARSTLH